MSEPRRWLQDPELSSELRALLEAGEPPPELPLAERRRLGRFVTSVSAGLIATSLLFTTKVVAALLVAGVGSVATWQVVEHVVLAPATSSEPAPRPHVVSPLRVNRLPGRLPQVEAPAVEVNLLPPPVEVNVEPTPVEVNPSIVAPPRPRAPRPVLAAPRVDPLAAEAELLLRARGLLDADPAAALDVAEQHARAFTSGQLGAERELIAIDALRRLGQDRDARQRAAALIASQPGSMYVRRARHLAGLD
jgi:hypothetical protein